MGRLWQVGGAVAELAIAVAVAVVALALVPAPSDLPADLSVNC